MEKDKNLTPFQRRVYKKVLLIPPGEIRSYRWVAERIGARGAYRAVGQALKRNPYIGIVPCHRVIKSDGSLGGFSKGKKEKKRLLKREGLHFKTKDTITLPAAGRPACGRQAGRQDTITK